jgi:hypothetical protein
MRRVRVRIHCTPNDMHAMLHSVGFMAIDVDPEMSQNKNGRAMLIWCMELEGGVVWGNHEGVVKTGDEIDDAASEGEGNKFLTKGVEYVDFAQVQPNCGATCDHSMRCGQKR